MPLSRNYFCCYMLSFRNFNEVLELNQLTWIDQDFSYLNSKSVQGGKMSTDVRVKDVSRDLDSVMTLPERTWMTHFNLSLGFLFHSWENNKWGLRTSRQISENFNSSTCNSVTLCKSFNPTEAWFYL